jgi:hypothetical protein
VTLSSASTLAEVEAAYDDNSDWRDGAGSVTKARAFAQACRILVRRYNSSVGAGGASVSRDVNRIQAALDEVVEWLLENDTTANAGGTVILDFRDGRT